MSKKHQTFIKRYLFHHCTPAVQVDVQPLVQDTVQLLVQPDVQPLVQYAVQLLVQLDVQLDTQSKGISLSCLLKTLGSILIPSILSHPLTLCKYKKDLKPP